MVVYRVIDHNNGSDPCWDYTGTVNYCSPSFVLTIVALITIDVLVVFGNTLVILAVIMMPRLRSVTNLFILSLAVSDWLLGLLVLPYSLALQVMDYWVFGDVWCSVWLSVDVWLCTASILNLCVISFDRYLAITRPIRYPGIMTATKGKVLIAVVWVLSFVICFPALIGWNDRHKAIFSGSASSPEVNITNINTSTSLTPRPIKNETTELPKCELNSEQGYTIYSAIGSFYLPMFVMIFFYWRIYKTATKTSKAMWRGRINCKSKTSNGTGNGAVINEEFSLRVHRGRGTTAKDKCLPRKDSPNVKNCLHSDRPLLNGTNDKTDIQHLPKSNKLGQYSNTKGDRSMSTSSDSLNLNEEIHPKMKHLLEEQQKQNKRKFSFMPTATTIKAASFRHLLRRIKRENKSAKTLGIIVGCFLCCWAPFFTVYFVGAFCNDCVSKLLFDIFFWIGYCNSVLNPCIYAMFAKNYRHAFKKLLHINKCFKKQSVQLLSTSSYTRHCGCASMTHAQLQDSAAN